MTQNIRRATEQDAVDIKRLIQHAYAHWTERLADLPDVSAGVIDEIEAGRMHVLELDGTVAGILNAAPHQNALHVMNIAVDPQSGGKGVGKALLAHAESLARATGLKRLALATHKDMGGNVSMYEHLGWHVTGTEAKKVLMQRKLDQD
ncbi:MAG: GNAT family N-acetyltransferase [Boseongicola sp.]